MSKKGRPDKYKTNVEPHLDKIKEMCLTMTEQQIADTLGVSYSAFRTYKGKYPALNDSLKKGRADLVIELKSMLIEKAKGFKYEEEKIIEENGEIVRREIYRKAALPDVAALNLLLKNYDKENWANDPAILELKKEELEFKKVQFEKLNW